MKTIKPKKPLTPDQAILASRRKAVEDAKQALRNERERQKRKRQQAKKPKRK